MKNLVYYLDAPGGAFTPVHEDIGDPGPGEIRVRTLRTSICQSDVVIYRQGLPRIRSWPAIILHEAGCMVDAVGPGVTKFSVGDLVALGCDIPCGDRACPYCGDHGTGDWTSCPNTQATGHEFPGFARKYAILPDWFVELGPIVRFDPSVNPDLACQLEPLACNLEGLTRVNGCIEDRIVVLIGSGSQSAYALQSALAMGARKVIVINRGANRLERVMRDFGGSAGGDTGLASEVGSERSEPGAGKVVGLLWTDDIVERVRAECAPFNEPHFIMVNASAEAAYRLATELMGSGTVLDAHAGVKGSGGKPKILHEVDLNNDIHYRLQCYQATHGSSMRGIRLARDMIQSGKLPLMSRMTDKSERFSYRDIGAAISRAASADSLKVIIDWED